MGGISRRGGFGDKVEVWHVRDSFAAASFLVRVDRQYIRSRNDDLKIARGPASFQGKSFCFALKHYAARDKRKGKWKNWERKKGEVWPVGPNVVCCSPDPQGVALCWANGCPFGAKWQETKKILHHNAVYLHSVKQDTITLYEFY